MHARPWVRWWWPGGDVDDAELARELKQMRDVGFGGAEIQSFAIGLPAEVSPEVFTYATDAWFEHVGFVLDRAEQLGLTIDLTLGSSWPCGGTHVNEAHSLKQLIAQVEIIEGPATYDRNVPSPIEPVRYLLADAILKLPSTFDATKMKRVAVVAGKLDADQTADHPPAKPTLPGLPVLEPTTYLDPSSLIDLTGSMTPDGKLDWQIPEGPWRLFTFYEGPTGSTPFYSADSGRPLVLDHLNAEAVNTHLQTIAQAVKDRFGRHMGSTLRSFFVDSLELRTELYWTDDFLNEFFQRRGYRLEPFLAMLFEPFQSDAYVRKVYPGAPPVYDLRTIGSRIRHDYKQTVSELMIERFFDPIQQWASSNAMTARIQAHGGPVDLLAAYGRVGIPETEGLFAGGNASFLKQAVSAAHLYNRPIVSSEILAFKSRDYMTTPAAIVREANRHFVTGVNQLVMHGWPYVYDENFAPPGWMPFSSPYLPGRHVIGTFASHLNDRYPFFRFLPKVNNYLARAQLVLRAGKPVVDLALYTGRLDDPDDATLDSDMNRSLEQAGYTSDYINDDALANKASVNDQGLYVGDTRYKAMVVSQVTCMSYEVAQRLAAFAQAGLPIVFAGALAEQSPGYLNFQNNDALVRTAFEQMFGESLATVRASEKFQTDSAVYVSRVGDVGTALAEDLGVRPDVVLNDGRESIRYVHRRANDIDYYFLSSSDDAPLDAVVTFAHGDRIPDVWDLWTGQVMPASIYMTRGSQTGVALHFEPETAVVVSFERAGTTFHLEGTDLAGVERKDDHTITGTALIPGTYTAILGNGSRATLAMGKDVVPLPPIDLATWDLVTICPTLAGGTTRQAFPSVLLGDLSRVPLLRYFSGIAVYARDVFIPSSYLQSSVHWELDLGCVHEVAEIRINDNEVTTLVVSPYHVDVTEFLVAGSNRIEIGVTTTLRNGLAGLGASGIEYYASFQENPVRVPSGFVGPAKLIPHYRVTLDRETETDPPVQAVPFTMTVVPVNYPHHTEDAIFEAIDVASQISDHISLQGAWKDPVTGVVWDCAKIEEVVTAARERGLSVTLQFNTYYAFPSDVPGMDLHVVLVNPLVPFDVSDDDVNGSASFSIPELRSAYLDELACIAALEPDYLVLGPEINFLVGYRLDEFFVFASVYREAYTLVKSISPNTQVGLSYQYDGLRDGLIDGGDWSFMAAVGPQDFYGLTTYFGSTEQWVERYPTAIDVPADYYAPIRAILGYGTPIIFTEMGWSSFYAGGDTNQVAFLCRLPTLLDGVQPHHVIWALQHDIDHYYTGEIKALNDLGLRQLDGTPKPAWAEVLRLKNEGLFVSP